MPEIGPEGQEKLGAARVLCLGAGGLGSPAAMYLAAAGVGTIGLVDDDRVDVSNLQRQLLHGTADVGRPKVDSARDRLRALNPHVQIPRHPGRFISANAEEIVRGYDFVIDGSDNFPTRYLANDVCVLHRIPNIYGSVFKFEGQASVFAPHLGGPCYRCLFPDPPAPGSVPNCAEAGVLGVVPGVIGSIQALEAIKLILGVGEPIIGRLLHFDAWKMRFRDFSLRRDPSCLLCGDEPTITGLINYELFCGEPAANNPVIRSISVHELNSAISNAETMTLLDVREPFENEIACLPGSTLIPLGEIAERANELDRNRRFIIYCKSGIRSAQAAEWLQQQGFASVFNLEGGIDAWAREIDPAMPRY